MCDICVCVCERFRDLKPPLLGVADGSPHIEDKFIRKSEISEGFVQGHGKLIWILLVAANLHHRSSWRREGERINCTVGSHCGHDL